MLFQKHRVSKYEKFDSNTNISMKLKDYEIQVFEKMLMNKLIKADWTMFIDNYKLVSYEYTGAGYFLKIRVNSLNLKKETIQKPIVIGEYDGLMLGFILYLYQNEIVMECHSWSSDNPPENVRDQDIKIRIRTDL